MRFPPAAAYPLRLMAPDSPSTFAFDIYRLDLQAGLLKRHDQPIVLRPKSWDVLRHLVERHGKLVTTHELFDAVWPDTAVTPQTLTNVIVELRKALGDSSAAPRFIETVPKRGFRFVATVTAGASTPAATARPHTTAADPVPTTASAIFVGRDREIEQLTQAWRRARTGDSRVVFVTGEAGIGKSTLLRAFVDDARGSAELPCLVASASCLEQSAGREPYLAVLEILAQLTARDEHGFVGELLARYAPSWLAQLPWLLPVMDMFALQEKLVGIGPGRMLLELVAFLDAAAERMPILLALDDLHWADGPTIEVLAKIAQRSSAARMMIVGSYRPGDALAAAHPVAVLADRLCAGGTTSAVDLRPFDAGAVATYLDHRFGDAELASRLSGFVEGGSSGNPLFIQAIVADLLERGWIMQDDGRWTVAAGFDPASVAIPEDLRRMIERQFSTLDPATMLVLEAASVAGIEFAVDAITAALERPADDVEILCRALARRGQVLRAAAGAEWPDGGGRNRYAFTHALYQGVLYERLPTNRRAGLHLAIGERLERAFASTPFEAATELARHFEQGRDAMRAVPYLRLAAYNALRRVAFNELNHCLSAAIALLDTLPPDQRMPELEGDLQADLGDILTATDGGGSEVSTAAYQRAENAYQVAGSARGLFRARLGLCNTACGRADYAAARTHVERLLASSRVELPTLTSQSHCFAGLVDVYTGRLIEARDHFERCLATTPEPGLPPSFDVHRYARGLSSICLAQLGHLDAARKAALAAQPSGRTVGDVFAGFGAAFGWLMLRDRERLESLADHLIDIARENAFPVFVPLGRLCRFALVRDREGAAVTTELRETFDQYRDNRLEEMKSLLLGILAEIHAQAGELDHAERFLEEAFHHALDTGEHVFLAELHRIRGVLTLARRPRAAADAERSFREAMQIARAQQARLIELRAAVALTRLRRGSAARDVLRPVLAWFVDSRETGADVIAASELLASA